MVRRPGSAAILLVAFAVVSPAQHRQDIVQQRLQQALRGFDDALQRTQAVGELARLGPLALPEIRRLLGDPDTRTQHRVLLLRALAGMERAAVPALPVCLDALGSTDEEVLREALAAIECIGPFADEATRARALQALTARRQSVGRAYFQLLVARLRVGWGAVVAIDTVDGTLAGWQNTAIAVAMVRAIAAGCVRCSGAERERLLQQLGAMLEDSPTRQAPSEFNRTHDAMIAAAMRRLGARETEAMRRALLSHPDPTERLRAVVVLGDAPKLSAELQGAIARSLDDEDPVVAIAAAGVLAGLGADASSLGALLQKARGADGPVGDACRKAAAAIFAGMRQDGDAEAARLVDELQRLCCGGAAQPGRHWQTPAAARLFARLARVLGADAPAVLAELLQAGHDCGVRGKDVVDAAMSVLTVPDQRVWEAALGLLAAQGRNAAAAATGAESPLLLALTQKAPHASARDVHECLAWVLAGTDASVAELQVALASDDARVALRAVVEVVSRSPALAPALAAALRQLAAREVEASWPGTGYVEEDLWRRARCLAALHLALAGQLRIDGDLEEVVTDVLVVSTDDLPAELQRLRREGLAGEAAAIERGGREKLLPARSIGPPR